MYFNKREDELVKDTPCEEQSYAEVVHFETNPQTGEDVLNDEGEPMLGFYWRIFDWDYSPLTELIGPYFDCDEAVEAATRHWNNNTWADC